MDRRIIYPAQIPLVEDQLYAARYAEIAVGRLAGGLYGENTIGASGLACAPGSALTVTVAPGQIIQAGVVDASAYGVLPASSDVLPIQYLLNEAQTLTISSAGATYQVYATVSTSDTDGAVMPFYNSANPSQTYAGPSNDGTSSPTLRQSVLSLGIGTSVPSGAIPLWTIVVPSAATSITASMITKSSSAPFWMTLPEIYAYIQSNCAIYGIGEISKGDWTEQYYTLPSAGNKTISLTFTAPRAGYVHVIGSANFSAQNTNQTQLTVLVNETELSADNVTGSTCMTNHSCVAVSAGSVTVGSFLSTSATNPPNVGHTLSYIFVPS